MSWINYIPVLGTAKGVVQCIKGDTEEGVQAMKDSVKIPVITTYVTFSAFGGAVIDEADDEINFEDRADAANGTIDTVKNIWNWGKKEKENKEEEKN
ncbi:hypothetical protein L5515_002097 [Caenorhabditis briggsae]|uniref:Uncharacterized protein n=1 Tax=Caenorhabditis briggsae TaxID=6238 RepID=A0AAE9E5L3_CAEBR|nr:hypothetical protein L5515_002097 [Caenorhabditis briggsae]